MGISLSPSWTSVYILIFILSCINSGYSYSLVKEYHIEELNIFSTVLPINNITSFPPIIPFLYAAYRYMNHSISTVDSSLSNTNIYPSVLTAGTNTVPSTSSSSTSSSSSSSSTSLEYIQKALLDNHYYYGISALTQLNKWSNNPIMTECYGKAYIWLRGTERSSKYYRGNTNKDQNQGIMAIDVLSSQSAIAVGLSRDLVVLQEAYKKLYRYITYYQTSKTKLLSFIIVHLPTMTLIIDELSSLKYHYINNHRFHQFPIFSSYTPINPSPHIKNTNQTIPSLSLSPQIYRQFINFLNLIDTTIVHSTLVTDAFDNFASITEAIWQRANKSIDMCAERWLNHKQYEISQGIAVSHPMVTPHAHTVISPEAEEAFEQHLMKTQQAKQAFKQPNKKSKSSRRSNSKSNSNDDTNIPRPTEPKDILDVAEDALFAAEQMVLQAESSGGFFNTGLDDIEYGITPYIYNICLLRSIILYAYPFIEKELLSGIPLKTSNNNLFNNVANDFKFRPLHKISSEYCEILDGVWNTYLPNVINNKQYMFTSETLLITNILQWWKNITAIKNQPDTCSLRSLANDGKVNDDDEIISYNNWDCFCNTTVRSVSHDAEVQTIVDSKTSKTTEINDTYSSCFGEKIINKLTSQIIDNLQIVYKSQDKVLMGDVHPHQPVPSRDNSKTPSNNNVPEAGVRFS